MNLTQFGLKDYATRIRSRIPRLKIGLGLFIGGVVTLIGLKVGTYYLNSNRSVEELTKEKGDLQTTVALRDSKIGEISSDLEEKGVIIAARDSALKVKPKEVIIKETLEDQLLAIYAENPWTNVDISYQGDRANIGEYRGTSTPAGVKAWILTEDLRSRGVEFLENYNPAGKNFLDIYEVIQQLNGKVSREVLEDIVRGKIREYLVVDSKFARNAFQYGEDGVDYGIVVRDGHYTSPHVLGKVRDYRKLNTKGVIAPKYIPRKVNP